VLNNLASHFDTGKKNVMLCDDELDLRQLFGKALKSKYNVILVGSGEDCIESSLMKKSWGKKNTSRVIRLQIGEYAWLAAIVAAIYWMYILNIFLIIILVIHDTATATTKTRYDYLSDSTNLWEIFYTDSE
jgi:hypothetical protein